MPITEDKVERGLADFRARIDKQIKEYGRSVIGVFPNPDDADKVNTAFLYTIGNSLRGYPELLLIGNYQEVALMNVLSSGMEKRGFAFADGELADLGGQFAPMLIAAADGVKAQYTIQATAYLDREDYDVLQVVLPDKNGLFPWEPGCAAPYSQVKVWRRLSA